MRVRLVAFAMAVAGLTTACPRSQTTTPPPPGTPTLGREERLAIARLEVQRQGGVARLIELAGDKNPVRRMLAIRALGRVGGADAIAALRKRLDGGDTETAIGALGLVGATGGLEPEEAKAIAGEIAAVPATGATRGVQVEALGRLGDASALSTLSTALGASDPAIAAAAGIALGRLGRAKIALDETAELAAIGRTKDDAAEVRFAATYALARGFVDPTAPAPAATDPVVRALRDRLADDDAIVRATAVAGLAARRAVPVTQPALLDRLDDTDWRVGVELVRALGGVSGTPQTQAALVPYLARVNTQWSAGDKPAPFAHVLIEGLRQLPERATDPKVRALLVEIARSFADNPPHRRAADRQLASAWVSCLALAALARPIPTRSTGDALGDPDVAAAQLVGCGDDLLPDAEVQKLVLEAAAAGPSPWGLLAADGGATDPKIAAAAFDLMPDHWKDAPGPDQHAMRDALIAGIARGEIAAAGAAGDAAGKILAATGSSGDLAPLASAVVARLATVGAEVELAQTLLTAIGDAKLDGLPQCQALRTDANPALRQAARDCVKALTGDDPGPAAPAAAPTAPPIDPAAAFGVHTWKLTTTQGEVDIALAGDLAPWHVAAIASLTREGFYDGVIFHRVVPDFVVQGGDPTASGWGGPGFLLPSEVGWSTGDPVPTYAPGGVGIADAGKDTGGSQWFAMLGRAPHLDGRYTWIGKVTAGQDVIDRLQIGDRIVRARIE